MYALKVLSGPTAGQVVPVETEIVIGSDHADLAVDDPEVSRNHVVVRPDPDGVVVEDLGSLNGTFVDGERVNGPVTLADGSTFRIGSTEMAVEAVGDHAGAKRRSIVPALISGVLVLASLVGGLVLWFARDDSAKARRFTGTTIAAIASQPAPRMTILGLVRAKPTGEMSAIIVREVDAFNTPGGPAVNLKLSILFSQPGGSFAATMVGTVRVTNTGLEVVRGKAEVSNGTGRYEDISGSFKLVGNNPPRTQTSRFTLRGTLKY